MTALAPALPRLPRSTLLWAVAAAWALAIAAEASGAAEALHHDGLLEGGLAPWAALGLFLALWQMHVAAAMLPGSLPLIRLFAQATAGRPGSARARAAFLSGYAAVWTAFGAAAFAGDLALHRSVERLPWLEQRPWLIGGGVLLVAGAFQLSELKRRCLRECRLPRTYLRRHYRRGTAAALHLGARHGLFCLGCCWALMLVMAAAGAANLAWMAPLALVALAERLAPGGERLAAPAGAALLGLGALVLAHPGWLPPLLAPG